MLGTSTPSLLLLCQPAGLPFCATGTRTCRCEVDPSCEAYDPNAPFVYCDKELTLAECHPDR